MKIKIEIEFDEIYFGFWGDATSEKKSVINELQQWLNYPNVNDFRKFISNVNIVEERQQTNKVKLEGFAQSDPFVPVHHDLNGE